MMLNSQLSMGKVISFPTDTVPALAVKPEFAEALFTIKQRPSTKPLILMGASLQALLPYVSGTSQELEAWEKVANKYFPGALTLVLPASSIVPPAMNPTNSQTIGIRIPNNKIALEILQQTGPLATTSANLSGELPLVIMDDIEKTFPQVFVWKSPELNPQAPIGTGLPSTVAKWTQKGWKVLRQGGIDLSAEHNS